MRFEGSEVCLMKSAPKDLAKLPACVAGTTSEAKRVARPDPGAARGGPGGDRTGVVLGQALTRLDRPSRTDHLFGGALDGACTGHDPDTHTLVGHKRHARRGRRLAAHRVLHGAFGAPAV